MYLLKERYVNYERAFVIALFVFLFAIFCGLSHNVRNCRIPNTTLRNRGYNNRRSRAMGEVGGGAKAGNDGEVCQNARKDRGNRAVTG